MSKPKTAVGRMMLTDTDDASMFEDLAKSMGLDAYEVERAEAPAEDVETPPEVEDAPETPYGGTGVDDDLLKSEDFKVAQGPAGNVVIDRRADRRWATMIEEGAVPTSHQPRGVGTRW